jgi:hypothetical protein
VQHRNVLPGNRRLELRKARQRLGEDDVRALSVARVRSDRNGIADQQVDPRRAREVDPEPQRPLQLQARLEQCADALGPGSRPLRVAARHLNEPSGVGMVRDPRMIGVGLRRQRLGDATV